MCIVPATSRPYESKAPLLGLDMAVDLFYTSIHLHTSSCKTCTTRQASLSEKALKFISESLTAVAIEPGRNISLSPFRLTIPRMKKEVFLTCGIPLLLSQCTVVLWQHYMPQTVTIYNQISLVSLVARHLKQKHVSLRVWLLEIFRPPNPE